MLTLYYVFSKIVENTVILKIRNQAKNHLSLTTQVEHKQPLNMNNSVYCTLKKSTMNHKKGNKAMEMTPSTVNTTKLF